VLPQIIIIACYGGKDLLPIQCLPAEQPRVKFKDLWILARNAMMWASVNTSEIINVHFGVLCVSYQCLGTGMRCNPLVTVLLGFSNIYMADMHIPDLKRIDV